MRYTQHNSAQGDVIIERASTMPDSATAATEHDGGFIVAHSESGHHHIIRGSVRMFVAPADGDPGIVGYLKVGDDGAVLTHHRHDDTHESQHFGKGLWQIRGQREGTPEGWRRVED